MSARIFVHPTCLKNDEHRQAFVDRLVDHGYDLNRVMIGPLNGKGYRELVRLVEVLNGTATLERMDGVRYQHNFNAPPEAA